MLIDANRFDLLEELILAEPFTTRAAGCPHRWALWSRQNYLSQYPHLSPCRLAARPR
ncbi:hypothetical protein HMPREF9593_02348 [Cutibacterium acnes HL046PA2]|nr:hypothetical protein HMPREF9593_02348 [Cutibacterium acnes HL046PA2]